MKNKYNKYNKSENSNQIGEKNKKNKKDKQKIDGGGEPDISGNAPLEIGDHIEVTIENFERDYELVKEKDGNKYYKKRDDKNSDYLFLLEYDFYHDKNPIFVNLPENDKGKDDRLIAGEEIVHKIQKNLGISSMKKALDLFMQHCSRTITDNNGKIVNVCDKSIESLIDGKANLGTSQNRVTFGPDEIRIIPPGNEYDSYTQQPQYIPQQEYQPQYVSQQGYPQGQQPQYVPPVQGQQPQYIQQVQGQPQQYVQQQEYQPQYVPQQGYPQGQQPQYIQQVQEQPQQYIQPVYDQQQLVNNSLYDSTNSTILSPPVNAITSQQEIYQPGFDENGRLVSFPPIVRHTPRSSQQLIPKVLNTKPVTQPLAVDMSLYQAPMLPVDENLYRTLHQSSAPPMLPSQLLPHQIIPDRPAPATLQDPYLYENNGVVLNGLSAPPMLQTPRYTDVVYMGGKIKNKSKLLFKDLLNDPDSKYVKYMNTLYLKINNQLLSVDKLYEFINSKDIRVKKEVKSKNKG
jgi:hypothetical protein